MFIGTLRLNRALQVVFATLTILFFLLGHLVMVVIHGWSNFMSMFTGWKTDPEYTPR